jgi:CheY-like chemotaxis protein
LTDSPARPLRSRRILVVDDDAAVRRSLELALREAGASVWTAFDGRTALDVISEARPDVVLVDLAMPEMGGWALIDRLAASSQTAHIPIVLQTAAEDLESLDRARKRNVAAFISKPFRLNDVVETCRRVADGARPLKGKAAGDKAPPAVRVEDHARKTVVQGLVLDRDDTGAQLDLERPLPVGQRVWLTFADPAAGGNVDAEVRWVTKVGDRFHHGLVVRRG